MRTLALLAMMVTVLFVGRLLHWSGLAEFPVVVWLWLPAVIVLQALFLRLPLVLAEREFAAAGRPPDPPAPVPAWNWRPLSIATVVGYLLVTGAAGLLSCRQAGWWWWWFVWVVTAAVSGWLIIGNCDAGKFDRPLPRDHIRGSIAAAATVMAILHFFTVFMVFYLAVQKRAPDLIFANLPKRLEDAATDWQAFLIPVWPILAIGAATTSWLVARQRNWRLLFLLRELLLWLAATVTAGFVLKVGAAHGIENHLDDDLVIFSAFMVTTLAVVWYWLLRCHCRRGNLRQISGRLLRYVFYSCLVAAQLAVVCGILTYGTRGRETYGETANLISLMAFVAMFSTFFIALSAVVLKLYYDHRFPMLKTKSKSEFHDHQTWR